MFNFKLLIYGSNILLQFFSQTKTKEDSAVHSGLYKVFPFITIFGRMQTQAVASAQTRQQPNLILACLQVIREIKNELATADMTCRQHHLSF